MAMENMSPAKCPNCDEDVIIDVGKDELVAMHECQNPVFYDYTELLDKEK